MTAWIWKTVLAIVGSVIGVYIGQELMGGGAIGWMVSGAIIAASCYPLFKALFAYRTEKAGNTLR
ncbi:hypothetical protein DevBK_07505 [Devosia sp. BK]|uniref:hypothetical protein n=1 Tax=Devosia sp. BK TaxID=2871706 RepID=UPI00293A74C5|nr:hypothetical protein [Devosia sp. BK]MDV3251169.1 hypothetical protein [Devosia sp. BK]